MAHYGIIANCNFESRDDEMGKAIHAARTAAESGRCVDSDLIDALETLESTLEEHADSGSEISVRACREAEEAVAAAWMSVAE